MNINDEQRSKLINEFLDNRDVNSIENYDKVDKLYEYNRGYADAYDDVFKFVFKTLGIII